MQRGVADHLDEASLLLAEQTAHALRVASGPVLRTELRLVRHDDPARVPAAFVEMHALVNGRPVRARASAPTVHEAVDRCAERFRHRIERAHLRIVGRHERLTESTSWHHGDVTKNHRLPPGEFPRPDEERQLIRRKLFALEAETIDEAVYDLELLDHDFFLFINVDTDEANLVARRDGGYRLWQPHPDELPLVNVVAPVTCDPAVAPVCSVEEARALLALVENGERPAFVFFIDTGSGGGAVVYRRRDGHDGLITAR